jgi:hypothetical protein
VIKPTIGRVVIFKQLSPAVAVGEDGECAAIIAKVLSDVSVNLCVIDADGQTHARPNVPFVQEGEKPPNTDHCHWMPYQVGQAAKAEQLQAQLDEHKKAEADDEEALKDKHKKGGGHGHSHR